MLGEVWGGGECWVRCGEEGSMPVHRRKVTNAHTVAINCNLSMKKWRAEVA